LGYIAAFVTAVSSAEQLDHGIAVSPPAYESVVIVAHAAQVGRLEPPPATDDQQARRLARLSAERYGRDALDVELDLQSAMERIRGPRRTTDSDDASESAKPPEPAAPNTGTPGAAGVVVGAEVPGA
jgi:hypothetical protein